LICCGGVDGEIIAQVICSAEHAIVSARDRVHERRIIANYRAGKTFDSGHDRDLPTMWLEIDVARKFAGANSCTIDHQIELLIDVFEFLEAYIRVDFAASLEKTRGEIIEVNRRVRQRGTQCETAFE
jgi:hypothetical protein